MPPLRRQQQNAPVLECPHDGEPDSRRPGARRVDRCQCHPLPRDDQQADSTCTLSEREPGETTPRVIRAGDRCQVALGNHLVITGWVDEAAVEYDSASHVVSVRGRDTTGDLVDCSAATEPGEWRDARLEEIATALCQPFDIRVTVGDGIDTGEPFARFRIEEGESVFEAIDRACRFRAVLPQSDGTGGLILGGPSRDRASVRLERGVNILAGSARSSWLSRYSDYIAEGPAGRGAGRVHGRAGGARRGDRAGRGR